MLVTHEQRDGGGMFSTTRDGARIAEMTYRRVGESRIVIDHTQVDVSLRGRGVARSLLDAAVAWARQSSTKISATCSYVTVQFDRDASIHDVFGG
jgi:predicted GNAT family acetyltransferase